MFTDNVARVTDACLSSERPRQLIQREHLARAGRYLIKVRWFLRNRLELGRVSRHLTELWARNCQMRRLWHDFIVHADERIDDKWIVHVSAAFHEDLESVSFSQTWSVRSV